MARRPGALKLVYANSSTSKETVMESLSKVAVIGLGKIGTVLATNLVKGNRAVIVADRTTEKAESLAKSLGKLATARDIPTAIREADLIILAVWFDTIKDLLKIYGA